MELYQDNTADRQSRSIRLKAHILRCISDDDNKEVEKIGILIAIDRAMMGEIEMVKDVEK